MFAMENNTLPNNFINKILTREYVLLLMILMNIQDVTKHVSQTLRGGGLTRNMQKSRNEHESANGISLLSFTKTCIFQTYSLFMFVKTFLDMLSHTIPAQSL